MSISSQYVERSFVFCNCLQHLGYITVIHALCVKLDPTYFAKKIYVIALLLLLISSVCRVEATGYIADYNIFNLMGITCKYLSKGIFLYKWFVWLYGLSLNPSNATVNDLRLVLYLVVTSVVLIIFPIIPGILCEFSFRKMRSVEACWLIYINFIFNVLFGSLPSRITSYIATVNKESALGHHHHHHIHHHHYHHYHYHHYHHRYNHSPESKKRLVRFLCHELRSPLNVAKMGIALLSRGKGDDDIIADVESEVEAAVSLLNNLLESEKLDDAQLILVATYCHFSFIDKTLRKYALLGKQKNISYEVCNMIKDDDELAIILYVDKYKIDQIIRNLISNAIKFTPDGGFISVILSTKEFFSSSKMPSGATGKFLIIEVKDSGVGVSVAKQCEIFQQFKQLSSTSFGGSGLGLFIAKEIAELHYGLLEFSSDGEGMGSSFKLSLPLFDNDIVSVEVNNIVCEDTKSADIVIDVNTKPLVNIDINLLICDDSAMNRKYLKKCLKVLLPKKWSHLNATFHEVDDGETMISFLEINKDNWPDIIFVDNIMVNMNGPIATKLARAMGFKNLIIGISGNMMSDDVREFYDAGCSHFLGKPVDTAKLESIFIELCSLK